MDEAVGPETREEPPELSVEWTGKEAGGDGLEGFLKELGDFEVPEYPELDDILDRHQLFSEWGAGLDSGEFDKPAE